ncbi:DUF2256 domain-containing protein [Aquisalinus flavus]|nr:DUF2256 domain-containing protein [Aquisalinus flavus]MBD0426949.1 DUF2256 domain-containing protein [Aquisalinus flavus]UNE49175.1 DUF2256 domain-containing protein [Aquisalinus flavus]
MKRNGKTVSKYDLPQKTCAACGLPFAWRKKWERDWDSVRYCSQRCRQSKSIAFPGEVETGSPSGNTTNEESGSFQRFHRMLKRSSSKE